MQNSRVFILPMFNLKIPESLIINTYMGNSEYEGNDVWGNHFYIEVEDCTPELVLRKMRNHSSYHTDYVTDDQNLMFVYTITDYQKENIVKPFLQGRYSMIDREYVRTYFPAFLKGEISFHHRILTKDLYTPSKYVPIREYWRKRIGQELPPNAEVWGIPEKKDEIYMHLNLT